MCKYGWKLKKLTSSRLLGMAYGEFDARDSLQSVCWSSTHLFLCLFVSRSLNVRVCKTREENEGGIWNVFGFFMWRIQLVWPMLMIHAFQSFGQNSKVSRPVSIWESMVLSAESPKIKSYLTLLFSKFNLQ